MEWLKTYFLVFILFIFTVKNVNSSPIVAASIETNPTVTPADITEQRVSGQLEDGKKMVKELEKDGLNRQKVSKNPSQSGFADKQDTVVQRSWRSNYSEDSAIPNTRDSNSDDEPDSNSQSTYKHQRVKRSKAMHIPLWIALPLLLIFYGPPIVLIVGVIVLVVYLVRRSERNRMVVPMNNGGNRLPNGQIENNLAQKSSATPATASKTAASRTSATTCSSEVAVENGMDKKTKTDVSSSNVEEDKN